MIKITDCDKNLNSKGQFRIETNDKNWIVVDAIEFFNFLEYTDRIDGHDPENETAWIKSNEVIWNPGRQEPEEIGGSESKPYQKWLDEFAYDDDILTAYLKSNTTVTASIEVKAEAA